MYAPSELLAQIEEQIRAEFGDEITSFEWSHEDEYTTILVESRSVALDGPINIRCSQIVNEYVGDQYIVAIAVSPIESVGTTDGLFNLIYDGGFESFALQYYAPECARSNPYRASIYYYTMLDALPTIHFDSPQQFWQRLFRPIHEELACQAGVSSFGGEHLASDLQQFLIEHLDFITHIAQAKGRTLHIPEASAIQSPNGSRPKRAIKPRSMLAKEEELLPVAA